MEDWPALVEHLRGVRGGRTDWIAQQCVRRARCPCAFVDTWQLRSLDAWQYAFLHARPRRQYACPGSLAAVGVPWICGRFRFMGVCITLVARPAGTSRGRCCCAAGASLTCACGCCWGPTMRCAGIRECIFALVLLFGVRRARPRLRTRGRRPAEGGAAAAAATSALQSLAGVVAVGVRACVVAPPPRRRRRRALRKVFCMPSSMGFCMPTWGFACPRRWGFAFPHRWSFAFPHHARGRRCTCTGRACCARAPPRSTSRTSATRTRTCPTTASRRRTPRARRAARNTRMHFPYEPCA